MLTATGTAVLAMWKLKSLLPSLATMVLMFGAYLTAYSWRFALGLVLSLWIHEMGPWHGDEINVPEPGKDYGWPAVSNGDNYDGTPLPDHATRPDYPAPIYYWHPAVSPSGLIFYTGSRFVDWRGNALLGGLSSEALVRLTLDENRVIGEERISMHRRIRDVIQVPDGSVLLLTDAKEGELLRLTPASR